MTISLETLPTELWRKILGYATDEDPIPDPPSLVDKLRPPVGHLSMRVKLSISYVSRLFRDIAAEYLYEGIEVKHRWQLESLLNDSHLERFSRYTVYLRVESPSSSELTLDDWYHIIALIKCCTRIQTFGLSSFRSIPAPTPYSMDTALRIVNALPQTLMNLLWDLGPSTGDLAKALYFILLQKRRLRLLQVRLMSQGSINSDVRDALLEQGRLCAEQLTHLFIGNTGEPFFIEIARNWHIPRLSHISAHAFFFDDIQLASVTVLEILSTLHGRAGSYLAKLEHAFPNVSKLSYAIDPIFLKKLPIWDSGSRNLQIRTLVILLRTRNPRRDEQLPDRVWDRFRHNLALHLHEILSVQLPSLTSLTVQGFSDYRFSKDTDAVRIEFAHFTSLFRSKNVELCLTL